MIFFSMSELYDKNKGMAAEDMGKVGQKALAWYPFPMALTRRYRSSLRNSQHDILVACEVYLGQGDAYGQKKRDHIRTQLLKCPTWSSNKRLV